MNNKRISLFDSQFRRAGVGGNYGVVEYDNPTDSHIRLFGRSRLRNITVRTNAVGLDLDIQCFSSSCTVGTQAQIAGGFQVFLFNESVREFYDNTTSGLTAKNVQDAIDEIVLNPSGIPANPPTTDNAIVHWDGTGGDAIQDSGAFVDNSGNISAHNFLRAAGTPILVTGEDAGNLYQRFGSTPGLYVNLGSDM